MSDSLGCHELWPARLLYPWNSPGKNTGVGCHSLLQGNLPNPAFEPPSPALQADSSLSQPPGKLYTKLYTTFLVALMVKNLPANARDTGDAGSVDSWLWKSPSRKAWQPTPVFLPGKSRGERSLVAYSPWGHRVGHDWAINAHLTS